MEIRFSEVHDWYKRQSPPIAKLLYYPLKLFAWQRTYILGRRLIRQKRFRPPIAWIRVIKDGQHVNLGPVSSRGVISGAGSIQPAMLIGHYKDNTVRLVYNVPEQYHKVGSTF